MLELRQSTAVTLKIGPFLDSTDGNTEENALTISQADVKLSKNGGAYTQKTEATSCTVDGTTGMYGCPIDATDTGTLGRLQLLVHEAGALVVWENYMVITQQLWDSKYSTDVLQVHVVEKTSTLALSTQEKADVNTEVDGALDTAIPASPTSNSVNERVKAVDDKLPSSTYLKGSADADGGMDTADKADVNTEADTALVDVDLDHLAKTTYGASKPTVGTLFDKVLNKDGTQTFDPTTESLEALRDRGDAAWITATGFALATVCTEARLAELGATNIPADVDTLLTRVSAIRAGYFDNLSGGAVALASICTEARLAELGATNLPADVDTLLTRISEALTLAGIADAVHDEVIDSTYKFRELVRLIDSALFGKLSGGGTATLIMRDIADTKARLTATVDASFNRTAVTKDAT